MGKGASWSREQGVPVYKGGCKVNSSINIEIPPSAPVTKEEREKWLKKAEYGGKTRRLIDHIERLESEHEKLHAEYIKTARHCKFEFERAEQAEAERDALAKMLSGAEIDAPCCSLGWKYPHEISPDCKNNIEENYLACWLEWARNGAGGGRQ